MAVGRDGSPKLFRDRSVLVNAMMGFGRALGQFEKSVLMDWVTGEALVSLLPGVDLLGPSLRVRK
jgi:hypothetical protein